MFTAIVSRGTGEAAGLGDLCKWVYQNMEASQFNPLAEGK